MVFVYKKDANFLISALKSSEKGVGVIYQLYDFILNTTITQYNFKSTNICQSAY